MAAGSRPSAYVSVRLGLLGPAFWTAWLSEHHHELGFGKFTGSAEKAATDVPDCRLPLRLQTFPTSSEYVSARAVRGRQDFDQLVVRLHNFSSRR